MRVLLSPGCGSSHTQISLPQRALLFSLWDPVCDARQVSLTSWAQGFSFVWQGCLPLPCSLRTIEGMKCDNTWRQPRLQGQQILVRAWPLCLWEPWSGHQMSPSELFSSSVSWGMIVVVQISWRRPEDKVRQGSHSA